MMSHECVTTEGPIVPGSSIICFSPDSDSYEVLSSKNNELAVHAFETGCWCRVLVLVVVCCELAVDVVERGRRCWVLALGAVSWRAGAWCWCWLCV